MIQVVAGRLALAAAAAAAVAAKRLLSSNEEPSAPSPPQHQRSPEAHALEEALRELEDVPLDDLGLALDRREAVLEGFLAWAAAQSVSTRRAALLVQLGEAAKHARRVVRSADLTPDGRLIGDVIVVGRSGVGKSTLINAIVGSDVASTGVGRPVTTRPERYTVELDQAGLIDTPGLELRGRNEENLPTLAQLADAVWFCIALEDGRIERAELQLLERLRSNAPVLVVATRVLDPKADHRWAEKLLGMAPIVTLARKRTIRGFSIEPHGLDVLIELTRAAVLRQ